MHFHYQNLTDNRLPTWRHGRAWLGKWNWEWSIFLNPAFHLQIEKGGYHYNYISFNIALILFRFYIGREFSHVFINRLLGFAFHSGSLWLYPWINHWDASSDDRQYIYMPINEWLLGKPKYSNNYAEIFDILIPMPEGNYKAQVKPYHSVWQYYFHRLEKKGYDFAIINGGIPFQGKGENSWDDALCGLSVEGSLEHGIGVIVERVLEYRRKYGNVPRLKDQQAKIHNDYNDKQTCTIS